MAELNKIVEGRGKWRETQRGVKCLSTLKEDTEMENGRHKVFNFQVTKIDTKIINEKLEEVFNKLNSAAKIIIALDFGLQNIEMCEKRYFNANENKTLFEKSDLLCTKENLITIQGKEKKNLILWSNVSRNVKRQSGGSR